MMRVISVLLIIAGLLVGGLGVAGMLGQSDAPRVEDYDDSLPEAAAPAPPRTVRPEMAPGFDGASPGAVRTQGARGAEITERLRRVPIAHETPREAAFGRAFDVTLAIDATGADSAAGALPGRETVAEDAAQVSQEVKASLVGSAFEIEALSPGLQRLSPLTANTWRWRVMPVQTGQHELVIEIYADLEGRLLPVRTFRDEITVEVSTLRQAVTLAQDANPLFMVLSGIGSVIGGLFGAARFFRK